ncbi:MAG: PEP-CTERM sorting domain-containing protein [Akkermansiaceae bacterium]
MKNTILPVTCLMALFIKPATAITVFQADFETGLGANTGTITYNAGDNSQLATTTTDPVFDDFVLFADPTSSGAAPTEITLTPSNPVSLTDVNYALFSFNFALRRSNGNNKSHFVTGYDSSDNPIFQLVLGELNEFGNGGNDRQRPGYATSGGGSANFVPADIASGVNPGNFYFPGDGNHLDGKNFTNAEFNLEIRSDGWKVSSDSSFKDPFTTNLLPTFDGSTFNDLAYVKITGKTSAAGGYLDNLSIRSVPEPSSAVLLGLGGLALVLRRRK